MVALRSSIAVTPHISPFTFDENIFNGDSVQVTCHVTKGDQPVNITWMFKEEYLRPSLGINTINLGDKTSMLIISSVTDRHMGNYACLAENRAGRAVHAAQLNVHGCGFWYLSAGCYLFDFNSPPPHPTNTVPPKIAQFRFDDDEPMNFGDQASVQCSISGGDRPIHVSWKLNGVELQRRNEYEITLSKVTKNVHILAIDSISANHAGNYTCVATNRAGVAQHTANLIVNGLSNEIKMFYS